MVKIRNTYKYQLIRKGRVLKRGVTISPRERQTSHQAMYPGSRVRLVGRRTTSEAAERWLKRGGRKSSLSLSASERGVLQRVKRDYYDDFLGAVREGDFAGTYRQWMKRLSTDDLVESLNDYDRSMHFGTGRQRLVDVARALKVGEL